MKKARNFLESGTVNRSWQVFFPSSGGRPATQPLRKWPAHSLPPQSVREMTEICLRINFYFSFFRPPPLPKATQSINTHTFCSTYSQSPCNKNNFVPLIHKAPAKKTIYSQNRSNKHTLFTPPPPNPGKGKNIIFDFSPNLGHRATGLEHQACSKRSGAHLCRGCVRPRGGAPSRHDANWPKTQQNKQKKA